MRGNGKVTNIAPDDCYIRRLTIEFFCDTLCNNESDSTLIAQPVKAGVAKLKGLMADSADGSQLPNECFPASFLYAERSIFGSLADGSQAAFIFGNRRGTAAHLNNI